MYQFMVTVSILVDDIHAGVSRLCHTIGVPEPRPQSYRTGPGVEAVFMRVHPKYPVAPTFLELIAPGGTASAPDDVHGGWRWPIGAIARRHGQRPIKWHATELAMSDDELADLIRHLKGLGVPVALIPGLGNQCFVGGDPGLPDYDSEPDGGLLVEVIPSPVLRLPDEGLSAVADVPPDAAPATMVRIVAREHLVSNLDETLALLERNLRWSPSEVRAEDGCRRAVLPFTAPRSARLELLEPVGRGRVADAYDQLGPGAWTIRISVVDVRAKATDLEARETEFTLEDGVLRPDPSYTLNVPFAFERA